MANDRAELTTPAAKPQEGAAGGGVRRASPGCFPVLGAAAAAAVTLGQAAATGQELATVKGDQGHVSVRLIKEGGGRHHHDPHGDHGEAHRLPGGGAGHG
eukprot:1336182-Pyramimonas_sp.AAC.1